MVSIALLGAEAWREESTPLAGRLDRRCEATSSFYEEAVAALRLLDAAPRTRLRSAETP